MEPTTQQPANAPVPNAGAPLVEFIRTRRQNAAYVFVALSVVFLACTAMLAYKAYRSPATADKPVDKPVESQLDPTKPPELPKAGEVANLKRGDYTVGWVGTMLGFLVTAAAGAFLLVGLPPASVESQRSEARILLLAVGGLLGSALILFGLWYFYRWSESLTNWLDKGELKEARWVLIPILMTVTGAGLVFVAIQPARAEERNNSSVRRLVYGSNFALTVLLLLVALVVVNVLFAARVPNKLDATETGFYSITDNTIDLLRRLDPPVTAYAVLPDEGVREINDIRQFLTACQDASNGKFQVKFISTVTNKVELNNLVGKYPQLDLVLSERRGLGAVVLATGADERRHAVIPTREFLSSNREGQTSFDGEARLFKELTLLADNQVKPIVYFTQSNGELGIAPEAEGQDDQKGTRLRAYLEKNYLDVRPLTFARENPAVPDDAAVVVVAGPRTPFSEAAAGALRKYVNTPRADGKRGKLVVLAGTVPGPGGKGVMKTGLEGLLGELNVRLGDKYIYSEPTEQKPDALTVLGGFTRAVVQERHPIALAIVRAAGILTMPRAREVAPAAAQSPFQVTVLLATAELSWLEDDRLTSVRDAIRQMSGNERLLVAKNVTEGGRPLAVVVSEGGSARAAVFGSSEFVSDLAARGVPTDSAPISFDLIGVTLDWLRERPPVAAVGIESKRYREYAFPEPASVDTTRLLYLPLLLGLLAVGGLGAGVWAIRRR